MGSTPIRNIFYFYFKKITFFFTDTLPKPFQKPFFHTDFLKRR